MSFLCASLMEAGSVFSHDWTSGCHPSIDGSMYTIPQRDTVAGEATSRSIGSKIKLVVGESWIISPLIRQS